jgi:hypothetical protein
VVEVKQHRAIVTHLQDRARISAHAVGRGELHHVACSVLFHRIAQLVEQLARHPLLHVGVVVTKGLPGGQLDHRACAFGQAHQALLHAGRQLARTQRQSGGLFVEGVDDVPLWPRQAVVKRQKGTGLDCGHKGFLECRQSGQTGIKKPLL